MPNNKRQRAKEYICFCFNKFFLFTFFLKLCLAAIRNHISHFIFSIHLKLMPKASITELRHKDDYILNPLHAQTIVPMHYNGSTYLFALYTICSILQLINYKIYSRFSFRILLNTVKMMVQLFE